MYDVIIIGAGVSGAATARELSRYKVKACVIEKEEDVCCGTSKANSAIVHAGYDAAEGSLMAKLNVRGNQMMEQLSKDLDFPFKKNGSLVVCLHEEDMPNLQALYDRGVANGVKELRILNCKELKEMEPNISDQAYAALYAPTAGIVCPFNLNIAMAENANVNGVEFKFDTEVTDLKPIDEGWEIHTNNGVFQTRYVVNAAGVYADKFHNMVSEKKIHITPRRGDYCLLDKSAGSHVSKTIFALPGKYGKGIINNCKTKIILNMEDEEAQRVKTILRLSETEVMNITHFQRGNGLISTNNNNITDNILFIFFIFLNFNYYRSFIIQSFIIIQIDFRYLMNVWMWHFIPPSVNFLLQQPNLFFCDFECFISIIIQCSFNRI